MDFEGVQAFIYVTPKYMFYSPPINNRGSEEKGPAISQVKNTREKTFK